MKSDQLRAELKEHRKTWHALLNSSAGAELVKWLNRNFDHDTLFAEDNPHKTAYRLGQRDVARFINDLKERNTDG